MSYLLNLKPKEGDLSLDILKNTPQVSSFFAESKEKPIENSVDVDALTSENRVLRELLKGDEILIKDCTQKGIEWDIRVKESNDFEKALRFIFHFAETNHLEVYDPQLDIRVKKHDIDTMITHQKQYETGYLVNDEYDRNGATKFLIKFLLILLGFFLFFKLTNGCNGLIIQQIDKVP